MVYILKLLFSFLQKEWKLIGIYFGLYIVLLLIFSKNQSDNLIILEDFLVNFKFSKITPIGIMNYSLEIALISYLYIKLLSTSIRFSIGYLFTRLSLLKFFLYNLISSTLILTLYVSLKYIIYCFAISESLIKIELFIFAIKEMLFLINIVMIVSLLLLSYNKCLKICSCFLLIHFFYFFRKYSVISYSFCFYLFFILCLIISIVIILKRILAEHLENSFIIKCWW